MFICGTVKSGATDKFKDSWRINRIHFIQFFLVCHGIMVVAGAYEEYISVPIGNLIVEII